MKRNNNSKKSGFTLVELSIVLVIIGFIIGGVLFGRDLIAAAEIRSQVSQLQKFDSAIVTFRLKYEYLPGDIPDESAIAFSLAPQAWKGSGGAKTGGNGDGIINDCGAPITCITNEAYLFFIHVAKANLINEITGNLDYPNGRTGCYSGNNNYHQYIGCQYPPAKIGSGGFVATSLVSGKLAYFLGITSTDANAAFNNYLVTTNSDGLGVVTPPVAFDLDTKLDDGLPLKGKIKAAQYPNTSESRNNYCITSVANNSYNVTNTDIACNLLIEVSGK